MSRIESSVAIIWNEEITIPHFRLGEVTAAVRRYWGAITSERTFPIPIWKAQKLFDASTSNPKRIALKVSNITNRDEVDAEWISYNPPAPTDEYSYFVLEEKYFNEAQFHADQNNAILGMKEKNQEYKTVLVGRIAKRADNLEPCVYMLMAEYKYKSGPGGGGGGATSGAKIPSAP